MNILFENPDKVNGLMTVTVEEADFKDDVEKTLKDYRKKANFPGFRPGMVPMGLIKKQFGASVKMDTLNKFVGEKIYTYIKDNKIQMLGEPLPSEKQEPVDIEKDGPYTFMFDIAVAPEFKIELNGDTKLAYYNIKADDKLIDQQVDMFASQLGSYEKADSYDGEQRDMLKGDLRELDADGNTKEGGITVDGAVMMPEYIKVEDQKKLFDNAKPGDIIAFNPRKAYPDNDAEVASLLKIDREAVKSMDSDFSYQVIEISRFKKAEVNQEMFDHVFGKDAVKSEEEFRARIAEGLKPQLQANSDYKFLIDVRKYAEDAVGELTFPDALLKRVMLLNNKDKGEEYVEKNYDESIRQLKWHLIKEQLVAANNIKVEDADVKAAAKEAARMQFAQYGMNNVPDEYLDNYAGEMLKKRDSAAGFVDSAVENKLVQALKGVVTLDEKTVTLDEFNELMK
ncbi:MAG: trigger factor [Prevotella sp. AG:487_50_53]|jgi:trigger factor|uniref:Trigger factor n=1 Tax=Leyella lascolaii TaxID=1776379 RepID=A0AAW7JJ83_9BACT|nr:trigger factor [Leyella lascolaii]MDN0023282.1 trigger factor [Leyella lascolaii]MDN0025923.1 trigger factor [Leyella lascolaii]OKZ27637.1 MAG: trigger factor [Prevotella sp. AG:487_50_53]